MGRLHQVLKMQLAMMVVMTVFVIMWRHKHVKPSVNTVYRTEASDSLCLKFIDGVCTTVIEVNIDTIPI